LKTGESMLVVTQVRARTPDDLHMLQVIYAHLWPFEWVNVAEWPQQPKWLPVSGVAAHGND